ncbi:MAG: hypothetical protein A2992_01840 [Elusimicrobia bacterium RIFCSPLOWO2_01_FULL_59_12]|nr:MAG: hypothetical protein A2992_01840 [Elusimicrobia bacterium RIFCSPLOWO2_01_FULL_59_12]
MDAPTSLFVQSHIDKKRKQGDGWGIGWFESGRPRVFKSPRPMYRDKARVRLAARQAKGKVLLGHVRWASNPLKLPRRELIGLPHTQPFRHGSWLFVHNGTLYISREVKAALGPWAKHVKGKNDSEVLFYWLLKHLNMREPVRAVRSSIKGLHRIWDACRRRYPIYRHPYHGLNWVLTNGRLLLAFCYVNPEGFGKAKALCHSGQPYYQLQINKTADAVAVASEPLAPDSTWQPLRHGRLLVAQIKGQTISTRFLKVI